MEGMGTGPGTIGGIMVGLYFYRGLLCYDVLPFLSLTITVRFSCSNSTAGRLVGRFICQE